MTDDETVARAALTSGASFWSTRPIGDLPAVLVSDGPHGLRKQAGATDHLGLAGSLPATCFPPAVGLAQSWDRALARRVAVALADEAQAQGVDVVLGPGINIKRSPLGGRNFEYLSEDPILTAELAAAWVDGLQSKGVGASLKHFAANNAETDRMRSSSDVDPRALHEIYLRAFRRVIADADPWTVMCSYNRINGVLASQNHWLLTELLRDEWGYQGVVMSDWGAVADRVAALAAGLDLAMPGPDADGDNAIATATARGELDPAALDASVERLTRLAERAAAGRTGAAADLDAHHALAREAAGRSIVLLKNAGGLLPLATDVSVALIGPFAVQPRYQGGGSSHVNATRVAAPLDAIRAATNGHVVHADGFTIDGTGSDPALLAEAVAAARDADVAVLLLGLAASDESEGFDRTTIDLPAEQIELARAVARANPRTVVVLSHGGVVRLTELAALVPAILDGALLGQAVGEAIADVLFGAVNPSGRLAETVPVRLEDAPSFLGFPGEHSHVLYGESIFVGYRGYDARGLDVEYPFGHGLSYTTFSYADLEIAAVADRLAVDVTVENTGSRAGREVVQVYTALPGGSVARPPRELKGFAIVDLEPGASERVTIRVRRDDLAVWDRRIDAFVVEGGEYRIDIGVSSRDIRLTGTAVVEGDAVRIPLTLDSTLGEALANPVAAALIMGAIGQLAPREADSNAALGMNIAAMMGQIPIGRLTAFSGGQVTTAQLEQLLAAANGDGAA